uniref:Thaumatin-like protein n=1 Tax=Leersia perrieri TaxID=77586 RepID=A0A0D9Y1P8_9ORYZ
MASPPVLVAVLLVLTAGGLANAATFTMTNQCSYTVWPAATPVGGGTQLEQGQTWTIDVPAGTSSGRVWGRTGCSFDGAGNGNCQSADCGGKLECTLSGQPPLTLAEYTLGKAGGSDGSDQDFYNLSVVDSFNLPMSITCSTGPTLTCREDKCPEAYNFPSDDTKVRTCATNSNYQITFCP